MRVLAMLDQAGEPVVVDAEAPHVRVDDLGLSRGDGVFETVLVVDGVPREMGPHLRRLERSADMLGLPMPPAAAWERLAATVMGAWDAPGEMALKLVCTRGPEYGDGSPTAFALAMEVGGKTLRARADGVSAVTLDRGFDPAVVERAPWLLLGAKTLSYAVNMAAQRYAESVGAEEAIFFAADGSVLEGPTSTLVEVRGRTLRTTPASNGVLPGTTQAALFRAAERAGWAVKVEAVPVADLGTADGVFLVSSVRRIVRVHTLDGEVLPDATEVGRELVALYEAEYA